MIIIMTFELWVNEIDKRVDLINYIVKYVKFLLLVVLDNGNTK